MEKKKTVGNMAQRRQILHQGTNFAVREAYKTLRTNIHFTLSDKPCKRICITSGSAGEGKSITMLNLALSVAESGQKVLLIDADLRRPAIGRLLVERIAPGLSNVLTEQVSIEDAIRQQVFPNLDILFSGEVPPNPSELLASDKFAVLIEEMSKRYDYILVDAPPINVVSDAAIIAKRVDGVLLLVRHTKSTKENVRQAVANLQMVNANILGYVFNGVEFTPKKYYGYYG